MTDNPQNETSPSRAVQADDGLPDAQAVDLPPQCKMMQAVSILYHMMMRVLDRGVEPEGLTGSRWHLLIVVRDSGQALTITQLSEGLLNSPQNVSRMVASLESDGLVSRDTTGPGRTVRVALTALGEARVASCAAVAEALGARILAGVPAETIEQTTAVLERMIRNTGDIEREIGVDPASHTRTEIDG